MHLRPRQVREPRTCSSLKARLQCNKAPVLPVQCKAEAQAKGYGAPGSTFSATLCTHFAGDSARFVQLLTLAVSAGVGECAARGGAAPERGQARGRGARGRQPGAPHCLAVRALAVELVKTLCQTLWHTCSMQPCARGRQPGAPHCPAVRALAADISCNPLANSLTSTCV